MSASNRPTCPQRRDRLDHGLDVLDEGFFGDLQSELPRCVAASPDLLDDCHCERWVRQLAWGDVDAHAELVAPVAGGC